MTPRRLRLPLPSRTAALRRLGQATTVLVAGLLLWAGAGLFWAVALPAPTPAVAGHDADPVAAARRIAARHPFGAAGLPGAASAGNITLRGVIAGSRPDNGFAVLSIAGWPSRTLAAGQDIDADTRLEHVFPDRVEILNHGVRETLALPQRTPRP